MLSSRGQQVVWSMGFWPLTPTCCWKKEQNRQTVPNTLPAALTEKERVGEDEWKENTEDSETATNNWGKQEEIVNLKRYIRFRQQSLNRLQSTGNNISVHQICLQRTIKRHWLLFSNLLFIYFFVTASPCEHNCATNSNQGCTVAHSGVVALQQESHGVDYCQGFFCINLAFFFLYIN